jgi:hypothetical protein
MTCERYWREGVVLFEHDEPDPHLATCEDCRRARAARDELVDAMPLIGHQANGDPHWQARVWSRIDSERPRRVWPCVVAGALAAACVTLLFWSIDSRRSAPGAPGESIAARSSSDVEPAALGTGAFENGLPWIEIISGPAAMRSTSARIGDRVRISARPHDEIRVYRAEKLMLQCSARLSAPDCAVTAQSLVSETAIDTAGEYQLVVIKSGSVAPVGTLDADLAAIVTAGGDYQLTDLSIR